jgi:hypothetical protein
MEQDFREKEVQQRTSEEEMSMAHVARCLGHVGPTRSHLVAPMLRVTKESAAETQKHETEAWKIEDWRGKLWQGAAGVISIPSNDSTFVTMMKRE